MSTVISFFKDNWVIIAPVLYAIWCEVMAHKPSWKSNSPLQFVGNVLKDQQPQK